jgi:homoserine dehydrogenase
MLQKELSAENQQSTIILLTHRALEKNMNKALEEIKNLDAVSSDVMRIRMEHLDG